MREGETDEATTTDQLPPDEEGQGSTPDSIAGAVDVDDAAAASVQDQKDEDKEPLSFVNQGLRQWESARDQWLVHNSTSSFNSNIHNADGGSGGDNSSSHQQRNRSDDTDSTPRAAAVPLDVDEVIDVIFSPRWRGGGGEDLTGPPRRFPQNVPLPQMVDVLVDLWEAEGLDT